MRKISKDLGNRWTDMVVRTVKVQGKLTTIFGEGTTLLPKEITPRENQKLKEKRPIFILAEKLEENCTLNCSASALD